MSRRRVRYDCVPGTQFESSRVHHTLSRTWEFPALRQNAPNRRAVPSGLWSLENWFGRGENFGRVSLALNPVARRPRRSRAETRFRMSDGYVLRPSIRCWRDHSAGISQSRTTPIPCGRRPSIAALTRSGARKASEIVMLTLRTLQPSRAAMLSVLQPDRSVSSSSQRRPRAIDATRSARFSERIGRMLVSRANSGNEDLAAPG